MNDRKEEYHFYKRLGICVRCHKKQAEPHKVMCWECAEKDRLQDKQKRQNNIAEYRKKELEKYNRLKKEGICTYCKHEKAMPGKYKCEKCLSKLKRNRDKNRKDIVRYERVSYGLCYICGKNGLKDDFRVCESCYTKRMESMSKIMYMPSNGEWSQTNKVFFKKG